MCFVWIWEQTAIISLYNFNWLVFITQPENVYSAVRNECITIHHVASTFPAQSSSYKVQHFSLYTNSVQLCSHILTRQLTATDWYQFSVSLTTHPVKHTLFKLCTTLYNPAHWLHTQYNTDAITTNYCKRPAEIQQPISCFQNSPLPLFPPSVFLSFNFTMQTISNSMKTAVAQWLRCCATKR